VGLGVRRVRNRKLYTADCVQVMPELEPGKISSVVTDPPYELGFMGKKWDASGIAYSVEMWKQAFRLLPPGGHLVAFGGSRTYHRMTCAIEDAGFEIRDCLMWLYGSGFPKSRNLDGEWDGWGTALKPAHEPIVLARKPLDGTVAENVQEHGTGALNIDGCRVGTNDKIRITANNNIRGNAYASDTSDRHRDTTYVPSPEGRWPANLILDEAAGEMLDAQTSDGASRFFYCPKTSKAERNAGLEGFEKKQIAGKGNGLARTCATCGASVLEGCDCPDRTYENPTKANHHPTVKPIALMRWLVRLVTPPGGTVLDPFTGSGSTGCAAVLEDFDFVGIEKDREYVEIASARMSHWAAQPKQEVLV
jgi:DNA modification methylase